jgi:hypothetical protein
MNYPNHNQPITRIAMPARAALPVLVSAKGKDRSGEDGWGHAVSRVTRNDLGLCFRDRRKFVIKFGPIDDLQRKRVRFAVDLGQAIAERSLPKLKEALVQFEGKRFGESSLPWFREIPLRHLAGHFTPALDGTHLCVWWSDLARRLVLGVRCQSIHEALFVLTLFEIGDIGTLGTCQRCKELFFRLRPSKKYCGDRCQAADGMRRKRIREKRQAQKKGASQ